MAFLRKRLYPFKGSIKEENISNASPQPISDHLQQNKKYLENLFNHCSDIVIREAQIVNGRKMLILFVEGLVDSAHIDKTVLLPLMSGIGISVRIEQTLPSSIDDFMNQFISIGQTQKVYTLTEGIEKALSGETLFLVDGSQTALVLSVKQWEHRPLDQPQSEVVIRGPREGFAENIRTNTALIRRRIRTPKLRLESMKIGRITKTDVVLAYLQDLAVDSVVKELRHRLSRIEIDGVIDSGYIREFIEDQPYSPFPQIQSTERPDTVAGSLLEGRCAILVDGSPFALVTPVNLWGFLQSSEDYYERFMFSTVIRWLRYIFIAIALTLPSLYVAITTFHQEMLPTNLILSVAAARESSPFPALVEALGMEFTFEALREAGVRLPKTVGQAVSIVGALVIGQAAVQAGIVSAPMVIVVSITGIANFTIPRYSFALGLRMLRFPLMILAGSFGLYGIVLGLLTIALHVCSLRSVGVPYTTPIAPLTIADIKDTVIRAPWWGMKTRPRLFGYQNLIRVPAEQKPHPPQQNPKQDQENS